MEAVGTSLARQSIEMVALASGRVQEIAFEPGQKVAAGDVLVRLDDEIERADLDEAEATLNETTLALERAETLREQNAVSQAALDEARSRKAIAEAELDRATRRLADRTVRAPFDGIVGLRQVDAGARVSDTTVITTLDDLSEIEIEFSVSETSMAASRWARRWSRPPRPIPTAASRARSRRSIRASTRRGGRSRSGPVCPTRTWPCRPACTCT
jgi:membrane fusion protein, multidrug efflux system